MDLTRSFVAIIVILSLFTVIYAAMPTDYFLYQDAYQGNIVNQEVQERFEATDLVVYSSFANDTMVFDYSSINDAPGAPQWKTALDNRYLEVWWGDEVIPDASITLPKTFEIRDTEKRNFIIDYYVMLERCTLYFENGTSAGAFLMQNILGSYGDALNMTLRVKGSYLSASIILRGNGTQTINEAWTAGTMAYDITYEIDFEAMKPNAFMLLAQILTFNSPDFGLPDNFFSEILTYGISLTLWVIIAILAYTLVTRLIPTVQGGLEN
jgi:hypothetical protein